MKKNKNGRRQAKKRDRIKGKEMGKAGGKGIKRCGGKGRDGRKTERERRGGDKS